MQFLPHPDTTPHASNRPSSFTASTTFTAPRPLFSSLVPLQILRLVVPQLKRQGTDFNQTNANGNKCIFLYMRVVLNSFIWKTPSSPKKNYFRRTFANSMFFFRGTCWRRFLRKTWICDILKLLQASDPSSHFILRQLQLNIYVLL